MPITGKVHHSVNYYNDNDPKACAWLRELISAGLIPKGEVDERSITDVQPADLRGFVQCHWFAGIGGWSLALKLAGWPSTRPAWTGSCPCQPLSCAGQRKGHADERHLWPAFYRLISECRPPVVIGEQVASKLGREWLCGVRADMEGIGYAFGGARLLACGVGAWHERPRLYWVSSNTDLLQFDGRGWPEQVRWQWDQEKAIQDIQQARSIWTTEPRPMALAYGIPNRMALLKGYGNSIVPQVAAQFVRAFMEIGYEPHQPAHIGMTAFTTQTEQSPSAQTVPKWLTTTKTPEKAICARLQANVK